MSNPELLKKLHSAIKAGDEKAVKTLLQDPLAAHLIDDVDEDGFTALYRACCRSEGDVDTASHLVDLLLKAKAKVDVKGEDRETPLFIATHNHLVPVVKQLLSAGANPNEMNSVTGDTALHCAAKYDYADLCDILVSANANINARNSVMETPLFQAARAGRIGSTYFLLLRDANKNLPNDEGKSPLYIASEKDHKGIANMLKVEKQYLKDAKSQAEVEQRMQKPDINDPEVIRKRSELAKKQEEEERKREATKPKPEIVHLEINENEVERTHDPLTGKPLPPAFKSVVGASPPPAIPAGVVKPLKDERYGGTMRNVGTGTGMKFVQRPPLVGGDSDDATLVYEALNVKGPRGN